ncbi:PREDICTED: uncharacterized protein LOC109125861 [Camelina sativa]|uniref:Uncharacterized protein LOC109125861 n=1 Tax=Camelina sativa TaxID=90675 RepID=A0ABM1QB61_CAMSA|nr:PREDICTED: uncharacterized protein LOC109125861 [Camelina sativa]
MEKHLEQYLQDMSIEDEEDKPLVLSNLPQFYSSERNLRSLIGRFLNPDYQRMSNWILEMPRIWRLYDRVRGVALSRDRFQFIFKYDDDINEILKTGVWTQDDWGVVMERWVEDPPANYLMFLPVWIRLRNLPVNHYTKETITEIAGCVGQVLEVPFDEKEAQSKDYVRVRILLDISKGLKNFKELQLPNGSLVKIGIDYERVRKRCFQCQKLTHDKSRCPFAQIEITVGDCSSTNVLADTIKADLLNPKNSRLKTTTQRAVQDSTRAFSKDKEIDLRGKNITTAECSSPKLLADVTKLDVMNQKTSSYETPLQSLPQGNSFYCSPSALYSNGLEASSSKKLQQKLPTAKRPRSWLKNTKDRKGKNLKTQDKSLDNQMEISGKNLIQEQENGVAKSLQRDTNTVVPGELPQDQ